MTVRKHHDQGVPVDLFGNYKAEWLGERIFDLFRAPTYFPDLERPKPCVLIGGRGTGKTTVLRSLSYEGQFAINKDTNTADSWAYYGFYYRVNTNRVTAFQGPELSPEQWRKLFGHYLNIILCQQVIRFLVWFEKLYPDLDSLTPDLCVDVCRSLNISEANNVEGMQSVLKQALIEFESLLNNIKSENDLKLSMQGAPLDILFEGLKKLPHFENKHFFFLIDEYENFLDDQQVIVNTLMKHASSDYTFKIGVRELGWRKRYTLAGTEELNSPADYVRVDIAEVLGKEEFRKFAQEVCDARLEHLLGSSFDNNIIELFPNLAAEEEAELLGAGKIADRIRRNVAIVPDERIATEAAALSDLELILLQDRATQQDSSIEQVLRERRSNPEAWQNYVDNYRYATLFQIADGAAPIRKLYCGWTTFTTLSASNIRYLLELVDHTFREHEKAGGRKGKKLSPKTQTLAAQAVGKKNLFELEGYREGALLVKLVLGLGRVFGIMARQPSKHSPEQNQFCFPVHAEINPEVGKLIESAVMHSALVRTLSNKLDKHDARSYDYALHPIFSAFFWVSHRRKRKVTIEPSDLMTLVSRPRRGISIILNKHDRPAHDDHLQGQLRLFGEHLIGDA